MTSASPSSRHVSRLLRAALAAALGVGLVGVVAPPAVAGPGDDAGTVRVIQANIKSDLSTDRFRADVSTVLGKHPDVVTYNEVPLRYDEVLAPEGYAVHRKMKNRYTQATAVAWRTDRWTAVDAGTFRVSNYRKVPPGKNVKLGLRFANWVTLRSVEGRTISVVAAHVAPLARKMPDLLRPSVQRLGTLVERLAPYGPVVVGGDFNVHYTSGRYPRDLLDPVQMAPTYDTLGTHFPTGDHRGATIDYLFNRGEGLLGATRHLAFELNSDHDAVMAELSWLVDSPEETRRVVSDPAGAEARRRVVAALATAIAATAPGESLEVVGSDLAVRAVYRKLRGAMARGVDVRYLTRSVKPTRRERRLAQVASETAGSSVATCHDACARARRQSGMAKTFVLRRGTDGAALERIEANRTPSRIMLQERTRLVVRTGAIGLAEAEDMLAQLP